MTDYLIQPPGEKVLPVTLGADRAFTINRVDALGDPVDFDPDSSVFFCSNISRTDQPRTFATITGSQAAFKIQSETLDKVKDGMLWQIVLRVGTLETPLLVGKFERRDGR